MIREEAMSGSEFHDFETMFVADETIDWHQERCRGNKGNVGAQIALIERPSSLLGRTNARHICPQDVRTFQTASPANRQAALSLHPSPFSA
jgi:hypothetical protein